MRALGVLLCALAALPIATASALLPDLPVRTLQGTALNLPTDLPAGPHLLVIGFTSDAREQTESWTRHTTATFGRVGKVSIFQVAVLEAPRLLQPLMVESIRRGVPKPLRERFAVATQQIEQWKSIAGYEAPDAAYVLLLDAQHRVIWRRTGPWTDEADQALLRELADERRRVALQARPAVDGPRLDALADVLVQRENINGLALAVIDRGEIQHVGAYGYRDGARELPLTTDTVIDGAALGETAFAYMLLQLVDEGKIDLDAPITRLLPDPLPAYEAYGDLPMDDRWQALTPRILLTHGSEFYDLRGLEADGHLRLHGEALPDQGHSSEGYDLLQLALQEGLGLDVAAEMQRRVFDRFEMRHTRINAREEARAADADERVDADAHPVDAHAGRHPDLGARRRISAAGSMETTIADQARMWAGIVRGEGLSDAARAELVRPQMPITSRHRLPMPSADADQRNRRIGLAAGLGLVVFRDTSGPAWFKDGHDDRTGNFAVCLENGRRCAVLMANDVRAEPLFPELVPAILGDTRMPWHWAYDWAEDPAESQAGDAP